MRIKKINKPQHPQKGEPLSSQKPGRQVEVERIEKQAWKPGNVLSPVPVVLVSCGGTAEFPANLITIAWTGSICSDPPMLSIAVRPERHSHGIIKATGEFVVNLPNVAQTKITDWCGMVSGSRVDKFAESGLTAAAATQVGCPIILECPVNIECRVRQCLELGSHHLFLAEVIAVQVSSHLIDGQGKFRVEKAGLIAYGLGHYFPLGPAIDHFGFSIRKKSTKPRR